MVSVNAIQGTLIADNAITAVHIATNAVSGTLVADNAITATHIAQNVITVTQLADDAVEAAKIADGVITTNHLNKAMISSQTEVSVATGDFILLGDTSDSNNLKKAPISSILAGTLTTAAQTNITSLGTLTSLNVDDITINGSSITDAGNLTMDIGGDLTLDADGGDIILSDGGTIVGTISMNNNSGDLYIRSRVQDKDMLFRGNDGGTEITAITIDMSEGGRVGIGNAPATEFHVRTANSTSDYNAGGGFDLLENATAASRHSTLFLDADGGNWATTSDGAYFYIQKWGAAGTVDFIQQDAADYNFKTGGSHTRLHLNGTTGNVGIGTTSPDVLVEIAGAHTSSIGMMHLDSTDHAFISLDASSSSHDKGIYFQEAGTAQVIIDHDGSANALRIHDGSSTHMVIEDGGNVGINVTDPGHKLEVSGDIEFSLAGNGNNPVMHVIDTADVEVAWFEGRRAGDTGAFISIQHNPATPQETNRCGIKFYIDDSAGNKTQFGGITQYVSDHTDGTEDGDLTFSTIVAGTLTEVMRLQMIESSGATAAVGLNNTAPAYTFDINTDGESNAMRIYQADDSKDCNMLLQNAGTSSGDDTVVSMYTHASGGDPKIRWAISANETFEMGIDNSDSDLLKISNGTALGTNDVMVFTGSRAYVGGVASPTWPGILVAERDQAGVPMLTVRHPNNDAIGASFHVNSTASGNNSIIACYNNSQNSSTADVQFRIRNDGECYTNDGGVNSLSDSRLKKNIVDYTYDIAKFKQFKPKKFDWHNKQLHGNRDNVIGFIAQDLLTVDSRWVDEDQLDPASPDCALVDEDLKAYSAKLTHKDAMFVSIIQQLITRLETAEAKIAVLEG